jgi:hypothetical protein
VYDCVRLVAQCTLDSRCVLCVQWWVADGVFCVCSGGLQMAWLQEVACLAVAGHFFDQF